MTRPFLGLMVGISILLWSSMMSLAQEGPLKENLRNHVTTLASEIGERNFIRYAALVKARDYLIQTFAAYSYTPVSQSYILGDKPFQNIIATRKGHGSLAEEVIVIGAHYDTLSGTPGADDNASGVAGVLELARLFAREQPQRTVQFVAFTNEEPPFFKTEGMGSRHFVREAKRNGVMIAAMLSLEMIGYFSSERHSQKYPPGFGFFYPNTADFIAVVGNFRSRPLVHAIKREFLKHSTLNMESVATFGFIPGVDWSDHWSFWREGYPAVMITDTALYRNPFYHDSMDTLETLDFNRIAQVVQGLYHAIASLAQ